MKKESIAKVISSEIFVYKADDGATPGGGPSYAYVLNANVRGDRVSLVRQGSLKARNGTVPNINVRLLEIAMEKLEGFSLGEEKGAIKAEINAVIDRILDEVTEAAIALGIYPNVETDEQRAKCRETISRRLRVFRMALRDLGKKATTEQGGSDLCLVDGKSVMKRSDYLSRVFDRIKDYQQFPLPSKPVIYGKIVNEYTSYKSLKLLKKNGTKGYLYYYYAIGFGLSTYRLSKGTFVAKNKENKSLFFCWSTSQLSSIVSHAFCVDKESTRHLLKSSGLPVPLGRSFEAGMYTAAKKYAELIGYPLVCKPLNGSRGEGVVVNIRNADELETAIKALRRSVYRDSDFIVEKFIKGKDYRIIVVGDEVKGALCRELASVVGDGEQTTVELMLAKHAWRMRNPHFIDRSAFIDEESSFGAINEQGIDLLRVPEKGEHVVFGTSCNLSQGADSVDVLEELHPSIKEAAIKATKCIPGLRYCGVDIMIEDHTKPIEEQSAGIIELNAKAAIGNCEYPMFGTPREVVKPVFTNVAGDLELSLPDFDTGHHELRCEVKGTLQPDKYSEWLMRTAKQLETEAVVDSKSQRKVEVSIRGDLRSVAMLATRLIVGPPSCRPTSVNIIQ